MAQGMSVVLLGDSILDNAPYTRPEPDTTAHLIGLLGSEWSVERLARDGATMSEVSLQLQKLHAKPFRAVLSIGGNDAIAHIGLLERRATSAADVLDELLVIADAFERQYETVARSVTDHACGTVLCTIYEVPIEPPVFARLARVPLALLNDRIVRVGARLGADILELRSVCKDPGDFVHQIEPSPRGAAKIAGAIAGILRGAPEPRSGRVFVA